MNHDMGKPSHFELEIPVGDIRDPQSVEESIRDCDELREFLIRNSLDPNPSNRQVADEESFEFTCIESSDGGATFTVSYSFHSYCDFTCDDMRKDDVEYGHFDAVVTGNSLTVVIFITPEREDEI